MKPETLTSARVPGPFGVDAPAAAPSDNDYHPPGAGQGMAASAAVDELKSGRIIMHVVTDWHPMRPAMTSPIIINASTLGVASQVMDKNGWCEAGGSITADAVPGHSGDHVTLQLRANLLMRLPRWDNYAHASPIARREWDRMLVKLKEYAKHRLNVVCDAGDALADSIFGRSVEDIGGLLAETNADIQAQLDKLDRDVKLGVKRGGRFGEIYLDPVV